MEPVTSEAGDPVRHVKLRAVQQVGCVRVLCVLGVAGVIDPSGATISLRPPRCRNLSGTRTVSVRPSGLRRVSSFRPRHARRWR